MHTFYIDIPDNYERDWSNGAHWAEPDSVLARQLGVKTIEFVCNSIAKISDGDAYEVTVDGEYDETILILKHGFRKLDSAVVEAYKERRRREREGYASHPWSPPHPRA
jgi:hypothetical protein